MIEKIKVGFLSAIFAVAILASGAEAQPSPQSNQTLVYQSFTPIHRAPDVAASSSAAFAAIGGSGPIAVVCNTGAVFAYVALSLGAISPALTAANGYPVPAGLCVRLNATGADRINAITATSTATIQTVVGTGSP